MRRIILFLIFIMVCAIGYGTVPVLAQNEDDVSVIKKVVEDFVKAGDNHDIDLLMNQFSSGFSHIDAEGKIRDYNEYKSYMQGHLGTFVNVSGGDLQISNLDIQDNKATLEMDNKFRALNLDTIKEMIIQVKAQVSLVKEGSSWKIIRIEEKSVDVKEVG